LYLSRSSSCARMAVRGPCGGSGRHRTSSRELRTARRHSSRIGIDIWRCRIPAPRADRGYRTGASAFWFGVMASSSPHWLARRSRRHRRRQRSAGPSPVRVRMWVGGSPRVRTERVVEGRNPCQRPAHVAGRSNPVRIPRVVTRTRTALASWTARDDGVVGGRRGAALDAQALGGG
jgi:hypothetical protein